MGLKFRFKNTQMKQKKRLLCGNNGNRHSLKNKTSKKFVSHLTDYQHQTHAQKFVHPFYSLCDFYVFLRASDVASINSITTVFEQQSNERTQKNTSSPVKAG